MKNLYVLLLFIISVFSCTSVSEKMQNEKPTEKDTLSFFPVTNYIKGQIAEIKNSKIDAYKVYKSTEKTDSGWLKNDELDSAFKEFTSPFIDTSNLIELYEESKFADQTLNTYTFTYAPKAAIPDSISLVRWDVYINQENNVVKRIFIVKKISGNKELQLTWQADKWCKTVCIVTNNEGKQFVEYEQTLKWSAE